MRTLRLSIFISIAALVWVSCDNNDSKKKKVLLKDIDSTIEKLEDRIYAKTQYIDSTFQYGEIFIYQVNEEELVEVQHIDSIETSSILFGIADYADYNNDNLKDIRLVYGSGARGSNTLDYLFIQKATRNNFPYFEYVKGSGYPPNLHWDSVRRVIESTIFHGGVTFADFKIYNDSLIEIGGVEVIGSLSHVIRIHYEINKGKRVEVRRDGVLDGYDNFYSRYP